MWNTTVACRGTECFSVPCRFLIARGIEKTLKKLSTLFTRDEIGFIDGTTHYLIHWLEID